MRTVYWGQVSDGSCEPETWNEFEVETTADKTEVRRQVIENGIFADPPELRLLLSSNAWCKWDKVQTLPAGDCKIKVIYRTSGESRRALTHHLDKFMQTLRLHTYPPWMHLHIAAELSHCNISALSLA